MLAANFLFNQKVQEVVFAVERAFYALDAATGQKLWGQELGGANAGGVITYTANGAQKVAVASGFTMLAWPTKIVTAKIVVLGLDSASANQ